MVVIVFPVFWRVSLFLVPSLTQRAAYVKTHENTESAGNVGNTGNVENAKSVVNAGNAINARNAQTDQPANMTHSARRA